MQYETLDNGFIKVTGQPVITPYTLNRVKKWEHRVLTLGTYIPFLKAKTTATSGKGSKVLNPCSNETHETLSITETTVLRVLSFLPNVLEIRTQYPLLPLMSTVEIARDMGIRHPSFKPYGKNTRKELKVLQAVVMTTDFYIDYYDSDGVCRQCALSLKQVDEEGNFSDKEKRDVRIREKLALECEYWVRDDVEWRLITTAMTFFQKHFVRNLLEAEVHSEKEFDSQVLSLIEKSLCEILKKCPSMPFTSALSNVSDSLNMRRGTIRSAFWKLMWDQRLPIDISKEIIFNQPLPQGDSIWIWQ